MDWWHLFGHEERTTDQDLSIDVYHTGGDIARGSFKAVIGDFKGAGNDFKRTGSDEIRENTLEVHIKNSGNI